MRTAWSMLLGVGVVLTLAMNARADDKQVTLKGDLVCGKCTLKETPAACTNVLQVKTDGKIVKYFLDDKGTKEVYHKNCCACAKDQMGFVATVTGVVTEKDGKKYIKASKVEVAKKVEVPK
jgi:hypothetical protein